jgi:RND family efflux transporter MFP subunit
MGSQPPPPEPPPPKVRVALPVYEEVREYEEFSGQTYALNTIEVRARVSGYLTQVFFKEGAVVRGDDRLTGAARVVGLLSASWDRGPISAAAALFPGQWQEGTPLFEIDPRPYRAALAQAEANLVQAKAHALRLAQDLARDERLVGTGGVSRADYDKDRSDKLEADASVGSAEAMRATAKLNMDFTLVCAPISGRVSRRLIDPWNMVQAGVTPLTTIVSLDRMYAYFDIDEGSAMKLRRLRERKVDGKIRLLDYPKMPVSLGLSDEEGFPHQGIVDFEDNQLDANTGTRRLRGVFDNHDDLLLPGLYARIRLDVGPPHQALLIAEAAIARDQGQKFIYVVRDNDTVEYRQVKVGRLYNGLREITGNLKPTERVVVSGLQRLRPDMQINPELVKMRDMTKSEIPNPKS